MAAVSRSAGVRTSKNWKDLPSACHAATTCGGT
jgi:hypothetical protein